MEWSNEAEKHLYGIQWRHQNFGWNTVYVIASSKENALELARKSPPKETPIGHWQCITGYAPYAIRRRNIFHCCPDPVI